MSENASDKAGFFLAACCGVAVVIVALSVLVHVIRWW